MKADLDTLYVRWNNSWRSGNHGAEYAKLIVAIFYLVRDHRGGLSWTGGTALYSWAYRCRRGTEREEMGR